MNPEECNVCYNKYNKNTRRPRSLQCGHCFCTMCINNLLQAGQVSCPACRVTHHANNVSQIPINYVVEALLMKLKVSESTQKASAKPESDVTMPTEAAGGSRIKQPMLFKTKLQSMFREQKDIIVGLMTGLDNVQSQLDQYRERLDCWTAEHLQQLDELEGLVQQHKAAVQLLQQETNKVIAEKKRGDEEKNKLKAALESLQVVKTTHHILTAMEQIDHCTEEVVEWKKRTQEELPHVNVITTSCKVRSGTRMALVNTCATQDGATPDGATQDGVGQDGVTQDSATQNGAPQDGATQDGATQDGAGQDGNRHSRISTVQDNTTLTIMDKVNNLTQEAAPVGLLIEDLRRINEVMRLMNPGSVYGVQQDQGHLRCSRITLDQGKVYLHCLQDQPLPHHARTLPVSEVLDILDPSSSTLAFLDLGWGGSTRGRVYIRLRPNNTLAKQFMLLCTGQRGHSYLNTIMLGVYGKGHPGENVKGGDYQYNNGEGGAPLLTHTGNYTEIDRAGTVGTCVDTDNSAQFIITTRDDNNQWDNVLGHVESGLDVVKETVNLPNIKDVTVIDCGVMLPL